MMLIPLEKMGYESVIFGRFLLGKLEARRGKSTTQIRWGHCLSFERRLTFHSCNVNLFSMFLRIFFFWKKRFPFTFFATIVSITPNIFPQLCTLKALFIIFENILESFKARCYLKLALLYLSIEKFSRIFEFSRRTQKQHPFGYLNYWS